MYCTYCRSHEHTIKNCPKTWGGSTNRQHMYCTYCASREHNIEACPKTYAGNAARAWHPDTVADHYIKDRRHR